MFQWICIQNKISPNIGTLLYSVLRPKLLNSPFASLVLVNLDFLLPHSVHFDNNIVLPLLAFETLEFVFCIFFKPHAIRFHFIFTVLNCY